MFEKAIQLFIILLCVGVIVLFGMTILALAYLFAHVGAIL